MNNVDGGVHHGNEKIDYNYHRGHQVDSEKRHGDVSLQLLFQRCAAECINCSGVEEVPEQGVQCLIQAEELKLWD